jgi:hypothetical protein
MTRLATRLHHAQKPSSVVSSQWSAVRKSLPASTDR